MSTTDGERLWRRGPTREELRGDGEVFFSKLRSRCPSFCSDVSLKGYGWSC